MATSSEPLAAAQRKWNYEISFTGTWARWLAPSLSDLLFISLMIWMFAAGSAGWLGLLVDGDTGWHIRTGEFILDHKAVPMVDPYSYSKPGAPWFAWEWLADVLFASLFRFAQFKGVVLLAGIVIALVPIVVLRHMLWRNGNAFVALVVTLLGVGASSVHYLARPHVFTLLLAAISIWLLEFDRRRNTRLVWLLVPLTALWTNLHGGFLALPVCLVLLVAGTAAEVLLKRDGVSWLHVRRYGLLTAACGAATLLNPYGYHLHQHIVKYLRSDWIMKVVQEFQSPVFRSENMLQFEVLLVAGLFTAAWMLLRKQVVEALWIGFWVHASLGSVRHVPVFVAVAAPFIAAELTAWWDRLMSGQSKKSLLGVFDGLSKDFGEGFRRTSVWPLIAVLVLMALGAPPLKWPKDFPDVKFPVKAAAKHADLLTGGKVFTSDQWADYLIFRFYPRQKVFFDGRSDFYGPQIGDQYIHLVQVHWDWEKIIERNGFDVILAPVEWPLTGALKGHSGWRLVEDDGLGVLFVRASKAAKIHVSPAPESGKKELAGN